MRKLLLLLPILFYLTSCQEDEQILEVETPEKPTVPTNPTQKDSTVYVYNNEIETPILKYYKGPDGKEYSTEAESFFKSQWSNYSNSGIEKIVLKKDSLFIKEGQSISKYKYKVENQTIFTDDEWKQTLGKLDNNQLTIYKNFIIYNVVEKENGAISYGKSSNLGFVTDKNIFPRIIDSPTDLKTANEIVFYGNVGYKLFKKINKYLFVFT